MVAKRAIFWMSESVTKRKLSVVNSWNLTRRPPCYAALQRLADEELRSLNGQIEFLLREALRQRGREMKSSSSRPIRKRP